MALGLDVHGKGTPVIATSQTTSVTLGASATQFFVGVAWSGGSATITSVTWNGVSMGAAIGSKNVGAGLDQHVSLYAITSPATGTHDIVVTASASPGSGLQTYYIALTGGDTSTGWRTVTGRQDSDGTGPGLTDGSWTSGDYEIHLATVWVNAITFDAGETTQEDDNITGSNWSAGLSYDTANGAVGCTDATYYAEIAVAAMPSGGGAAKKKMLPGLLSQRLMLGH